MTDLSPDIEQAKLSLADKYISDLRKELGFFQGSLLYIVEKTLKNMLLQQEVLGEKIDTYKFNRLETFLIDLFPSKAEYIYKFVRDKQIVLVQAKTRDDLEKLQQGIIPAQLGGDIPGGSSGESADDDEQSGQSEQGSSNNTVGESSQEIAGGSSGESADAESIQGNDQTKDNELVNNEEIKSNTITGLSNETESVAVAVVAGEAAGETDRAARAGKAGVDKILDRKYGTINLAEGIDVRTTEKSFGDIHKLLRHRMTDPKLTPVMRDAIKRSMDEFDWARQNAGTISDLELRKTLQNTLPTEVCKTLFASLSDADQTILMKISSNPKDIEALAKLTDPNEIKTFLKGKGIANSSDELVHIIAQSTDVRELKGITRILGQSKNISKMAKVTGSIPFLDAIAFGFDYRTWLEGKDLAAKESEINKVRGDLLRNKADVQFAIQCVAAGVSVAGLIAVSAGLVASGPVGWVVLGVGAASYAVAESINALIFDPGDFYTQNRENYIHQYRIELTHAIVQSTVGSSSEHGTDIITPSINESVAGFVGVIDEGQKSITLKEAYRSLIYQEEIDAFPLISQYGYTASKKNPIPKASEEKYKKDKEALGHIIDERMKYIAHYLPENNRGKQSPVYTSFVNNIKANKSVESVEKIVKESATYAMIQKDDTLSDKNISVSDYKKIKLDELKSQNGKLWNICNEWKKNPSYYKEIIHHIQSFTSESDITPARQQVMDYVTSYDTLHNLNIPYTLDTTDYPQTDFNSLVDLLDDPSQGYAGLKICLEDASESIVNGRVDTHSTDDEEGLGDNIGQRVIYEIYKKQGYKGKNSMRELIEYGKEVDKGGSLGIYYDAGWKVNEDRAIDRSIDLDDIEKLGVEEFFDKYFTRTDYLAVVCAINPIAGIALSVMKDSLPALGIHPGDKSIIDTKTETADTTLNNEFLSNFKATMIECKVHKTPEYQKTVADMIIKHIDTYATAGSMIKLPQYLIEAAHNAHIGPVENFLFQRDENNKTIALTSNAHKGNALTLPGCTIQYVGAVRDRLTSNETILIEDSRRSMKRLQSLRDVESSLRSREDEINIMPEREKIVGDKVKKQEDMERALLSYDVAYGRSEFLQSYTGQKQFYDHMYLSFLLNSASNTFNNNNNSNEMFTRSLTAASLPLEACHFIKGNEDTKKKELIIPEMFAKSNNIQTMFQEMGDSYKPDGKKTIKELLMSDNIDEQKQGKYYATELLISIVEGAMGTYDSDGVLTDIASPKNGSLNMYKKKVQERITANIKSARGNYVYNPESLLNRDDPSEIIANPLTVKTVSASDATINKQTQDLLHKIEKTDVTNPVFGSIEKVNKQDQRGKISYNPDTKVLSSRGYGVSIDTDKRQIQGLGLHVGTIDELVWLANLTNMALSIAQKNDPQNKESFSRADSVRTRDGIFLGSTRIVVDDTFRSHCPSISDDKVHIYIDYLNKRPKQPPPHKTIKKEQAFA